MISRSWIVGFLLAGGAFLSLAGWSFNEQINVTIRTRECAKALERIRIASGRFPEAYSCQDHRGRAIYYQRMTEGFLLSSKEGVTADRGDVCFFPWRAVIFSESGALAHCSI